MNASVEYDWIELPTEIMAVYDLLVCEFDVVADIVQGVWSRQGFEQSVGSRTRRSHLGRRPGVWGRRFMIASILKDRECFGV